MDTNHIAEAAHALRTAELTRTSIPPLTETYPGMTVHDAYAIQVALAQKHFADGRTLIGHKIGLTSKAMQRQMGVDTPDYGHLFADMVQNERGVFLANDLISPRVEPEIAFVLKLLCADRASPLRMCSVQSTIPSRRWRLSIPGSLTGASSSKTPSQTTAPLRGLCSVPSGYPPTTST